MPGTASVAPRKRGWTGVRALSSHFRIVSLMVVIELLQAPGSSWEDSPKWNLSPTLDHYVDNLTELPGELFTEHYTHIFRQLILCLFYGSGEQELENCSKLELCDFLIGSPGSLPAPALPASGKNRDSLGQMAKHWANCAKGVTRTGSMLPPPHLRDDGIQVVRVSHLPNPQPQHPVQKKNKTNPEINTKSISMKTSTSLKLNCM